MRGEGRTGWGLTLLCVGVLVQSLAVHAHYGPDGRSLCQPWICSCYFNQIYYDEGDTWPDPDEPCARYRCVDNGYFEKYKSGCNFKGTCYEVGTTWTEGCFAYKCFNDNLFYGYQLQEAACSWKDSNCYKVGERALERCDEYECQLVDGCYTMTLVKSECYVGASQGGGCKPLYSFWQDECAVYQCLHEDKEQLLARIQTHTHDVMMWPRGHYALYEPGIGCPNMGETFWQEGWRRQCGDGCNFYSDHFYMKGNYTEKMMEHNFCVHHDVDDPSVMPLYQTYWEPGRYCILKYNGSCPSRFKEGFVEMTDEECNGTLYGNTTAEGYLPDGNFTANSTRLEFCCRYDGEIDRPIVLPAKHAFILFLAENETDCQMVRGMHHEIQFLSFCDMYDGAFREMGGALPVIKTGDNNTLINLCYYSPYGCGCTGEDEEIVAVGDSVVKDCVTRECRDFFTVNVLVVTEGGCMDSEAEVCRAENETWVRTSGESCYQMQCVRVQHDNVSVDVSFEIIQLHEGCRDKKECRKVGYDKVKGCYTTQCQKDLITLMLGFVVTTAGCADSNGECHDSGEVIQQDCVKLKCDRSVSSCGWSILEGACGRPPNCIPVGTNWTSGCTNYTCTQKRQGGYYTWSADEVDPGCQDHLGNCHEEGTQLNYSCVTYECMHKQASGFYPLPGSGGCYTSEGCKDPNSNFTIDCSDYNCTVFENGTRAKMLVKARCNDNGQCYEVGEAWMDADRCVNYTCGEDGEGAVVGFGCAYQGVCYHPNQIFKLGCASYQCRVNATHRWFTFLHPGCKEGNNCYEPGDNYTVNCNVYRCDEHAKSCTGTLIERGCQNTAGECVATGEEIKLHCSTYICRPNGTNSPYFLQTPGCNISGHCYDVGNSAPHADCGSYSCEYKTSHDPSDGLVIKFSSKCQREGVCYEDDEQFKIGCASYTCRYNGTHRWFQFDHPGCKMDGNCYDPGEVFTSESTCHTYRCREDKKTCEPLKIETGCKDSTTGQCVETGQNVTKDCSVYRCQPNGLNDPYVLLEEECSIDGECVPQGEIAISSLCGVVKTCDHKVMGDPSSPLVIYTSGTICEKDGACLDHGDITDWDMSHSSFCQQSMCYNGQVHLIAIKCKDVNSNCIEAKEDPVDTYQRQNGDSICTSKCLKKGYTITYTDVVCS